MNIPYATLIVAAALAGALVAGPAPAQQWSYEGGSAPENWGKLDPAFALCATGRNQSPIDVSRTIVARLEPLKLKYAAGASDIVNNGHTVEVSYAPGSTLVVDGRDFELTQFHFHAPSENRIAGRSFPLEAHLVHADKTGNLAVIAVMFAEGAPNKFLSQLWDKMPAAKGKAALPAGLNAMQLLPARKAYYRFDGSLTTPPCTEGVRWLVMKSPITASKAQVEQFAKAIGRPNNRPLQPVNARPVLR